jgi:hypothetical protein
MFKCRCNNFYYGSTLELQTKGPILLSCPGIIENFLPGLLKIITIDRVFILTTGYEIGQIKTGK